jgi:hypothetical protein
MATQAPFVFVGEVPVYLLSDGSLIWLAGADIDGDGTGPNTYGDPDYQNNTTLQWNGAGLNAEVDRFIVVPPDIIDAVGGIVMGCQAKVTNVRAGLTFSAVVGDEGPRSKAGEMSIALAEALEIPSSPTMGGTQEPLVCYQIWPGVPALVNGKQYRLQAS